MPERVYWAYASVPQNRIGKHFDLINAKRTVM